MGVRRLKLVVQVSFLFYAIGILIYFFNDREGALWFAVGGGLCLVNLTLAYFVVARGLSSAKSKGIFLSLVMLKSISFVGMVAAILTLLKPQVLPFTLGLGLVMVGSVAVALIEGLALMGRKNKEPA